MYIRRNIRFRHVLNDSWTFLILMGIWSTLTVYIHEILGHKEIDIPMVPVSMIGIGVSLYLGFKSTQAYGRWWEARQIWDEIINYSRTWGSQVFSLVYDKEGKSDPLVEKELVYRQLAWINALVFQLRKDSRLPESNKTEFFEGRLKLSENPNDFNQTKECYTRFLSDDEIKILEGKKNPAVHILKLQAEHLKRIIANGQLDSDRLVTISKLIAQCYDTQGKCERIKNTPFPRQIAYFGTVFTRIFVALIPLAFLNAFDGEATKLNFEVGSLIHHEYMFSLVPFAMIIGWIFFIMEKISDSTEDPFEGGVSDVPISALAREIEIDLREMLNEKKIPKSLEAIDDVLY